MPASSCSPRGGRITPRRRRDVTDLPANRYYRYYGVTERESNALPETVTRLLRPRTFHQKPIRGDELNGNDGACELLHAIQ